ncbi:hypothetical protein L195_g055135 [Trifolium pratense]|uniref:CASP-like protein n=1 Tax=Trifolium pratense TaxID=57577 RepID=A0A2K3KJP9_TRIPR|nr:hypothetical protein L195_g055135 [Trifolium pratense]
MMDHKHTSGDSEAILRSKKEVKWYMALLGIRIVAFVLCLIAFYMLGANEQKVLVNEEITNWFSIGISVKTPYEFRWYDYDEFKYVALLTPFYHIVARFVFVEIEILSYAIILAKNRIMTYGWT